MTSLKGKPGEWYQNESYGGYFDKDGNLVVCEEYGTDADFDTHAVDIQNGNGYYDEFCRYRSFGKD